MTSSFVVSCGQLWSVVIRLRSGMLERSRSRLVVADVDAQLRPCVRRQNDVVFVEQFGWHETAGEVVGLTAEQARATLRRHQRYEYVWFERELMVSRGAEFCRRGNGIGATGSDGSRHRGTVVKVNVPSCEKNKGFCQGIAFAPV